MNAMKNIYQTISTILLCFLVAVSVRAEYTISLQEYISPSENCRANVYVTVDGNAGPFQVGFYRLDFPDIAYATFEDVPVWCHDTVRDV